MSDKNNISYVDGYVYITCENCGKEYGVLTNGGHLLPEDASEKEKEEWEWYLKCQKCNYKNFHYE